MRDYHLRFWALQRFLPLHQTCWFRLLYTIIAEIGNWKFRTNPNQRIWAQCLLYIARFGQIYSVFYLNCSWYYRTGLGGMNRFGWAWARWNNVGRPLLFITHFQKDYFSSNPPPSVFLFSHEIRQKKVFGSFFGVNTTE
jgi:hypothetical protein